MYLANKNQILLKWLHRSVSTSIGAAWALFMIVSIGVDIVEVYRIAEIINRTPRFAQRVFTVSEREYCVAKGAAAAQSYAGRFCAKEAFLKALRTGWRGKISWQDIEVLNDSEGAPYMKITGEARNMLEQLGRVSMHLSIAHTSEHAIAEVIIERV
jgi:holo-[acyl-carrier protein] synthase